jgi:hypothetical protein
MMDSTDRSTSTTTIRRGAAWIGVVIALALIAVCLLTLTGCGCQGHGGVLNNNKGTVTCADGTVG